MHLPTFSGSSSPVVVSTYRANSLGFRHCGQVCRVDGPLYGSRMKRWGVFIVLLYRSTWRAWRVAVEALNTYGGKRFHRFDLWRSLGGVAVGRNFRHHATAPPSCKRSEAQHGRGFQAKARQPSGPPQRSDQPSWTFVYCPPSRCFWKSFLSPRYRSTDRRAMPKPSPITIALAVVNDAGSAR